MTQETMNEVCEKLNTIVCKTRIEVFENLCELMSSEWKYIIKSKNGRTVYIINELTKERFVPITKKHSDGHDLFAIIGKPHWEMVNENTKRCIGHDTYINPLYRNKVRVVEPATSL